MHAKPGDWLVVKGTLLNAPERFAKITEILSATGEPPFVVRWAHNDVEAVVVPGPDARVITSDEREREAKRSRDRIDEVQHAIALQRARRSQHSESER